jgi:hypothetical protein
MGRALDRSGFARGFKKDVRSLGLLTGLAIQQTALSDWVRSLKKSPARNFISADSATRGTVRTYVGNVRLVEALAPQYGFTPIYVWQPNLHATTKKPNKFEERLLRSIARDPFHSRLQQVHRVLPRMLDSSMGGVAPGRFVNDAGLFAGDTMAVYTDWLGHNTEESVPRIVDTFWPTLETATRAAIVRRRGIASRAAPAIAAPRAN